MPRIEVEGYGTFDVPAGSRLVNALEANEVDILHRCGGYARCTTCRVAFTAGEPAQRIAMQPLIGISGALVQTNGWSPPVVGHRRSYVDAVLQAGGLPIVLPPQGARRGASGGGLRTRWRG